MPRRLSRPPRKKKAIPARETTYQYLKSSILSGRFNAGDRLTEEHLAEELGVSRTPVREALHKLELEGLVKSLETRGVHRSSRLEGGNRGTLRHAGHFGRIHAEAHLPRYF